MFFGLKPVNPWYLKKEECAGCPLRAPARILPKIEGQGWGLIDLPLRATFSPAHPLARGSTELAEVRDVLLAQARAFRDRALREHRRSSGSIPPSVPGAQDQRGRPSHLFYRVKESQRSFSAQSW